MRSLCWFLSTITSHVPRVFITLPYYFLYHSVNLYSMSSLCCLSLTLLSQPSPYSFVSLDDQKMKTSLILKCLDVELAICGILNILVRDLISDLQSWFYLLSVLASQACSHMVSVSHTHHKTCFLTSLGRDERDIMFFML